MRDDGATNEALLTPLAAIRGQLFLKSVVLKIPLHLPTPFQ